MHDMIKLQINTVERVASIETKLDGLIESVQTIKILHEQCPARGDYEATAALHDRHLRNAARATPLSLWVGIICGISALCVSILALYR